MSTQISEHFTLEELYASATAKAKGIDNTPKLADIVNLIWLTIKVLEPLRKAQGVPVRISSGYRCQRLNAAVGGVATSQHMRGQAADICIDGDMEKGRRWFEWIKTHCDFDQLIWEHSSKGTYWIHVSYNYQRNRKQVINNLLKR